MSSSFLVTLCEKEITPSTQEGARKADESDESSHHQATAFLFVQVPCSLNVTCIGMAALFE